MACQDVEHRWDTWDMACTADNAYVGLVEAFVEGGSLGLSLHVLHSHPLFLGPFWDLDFVVQEVDVLLSPSFRLLDSYSWREPDLEEVEPGAYVADAGGMEMVQEP